MKPCTHCRTPFPAKTNQEYCSPECAVWARVERRGPDECWPWRGACNHLGYGQINFRGKRLGATRVVTGAMPGETVLHRCDNPPCCNPAHLVRGTQALNNADKIAKGRHNTPHGERYWKATLTEDEVREARRRLAAGDLQRVIAADLGVKRTVIADIKRGMSYRHVG